MHDVDRCPEGEATDEIRHVVVGEADAARADVRTDRQGVVGAVDPDHTLAAGELLERVREPGQPVGVVAVDGVGAHRTPGVSQYSTSSTS